MSLPAADGTMGAFREAPADACCPTGLERCGLAKKKTQGGGSKSGGAPDLAAVLRSFEDALTATQSHVPELSAARGQEPR